MPYAEKDVSKDYDAAVEMMRRTGGQQGVPVITLDDEVVIGFDRPRLERILASAGSGRPVFGAAIADASRITMQQGKVPLFGAYVGKVAPGSPAERAGLQPGDIITQLNLRQISNADSFEEALKSLERGSPARVTYTRGDRALTSEVRV